MYGTPYYGELRLALAGLLRHRLSLSVHWQALKQTAEALHGIVVAVARPSAMQFRRTTFILKLHRISAVN
jgi:hypothetical protein